MFQRYDQLVAHALMRPLSVIMEKELTHGIARRFFTKQNLAMHPEVRVIDRGEYYRVIKPEVSKVYSSEDALVLLVKNRHHGPWDESEQLKE